MRGTALFLVMLLVPAGAIAQEATRSFAALNRQGVLVEGEEILITCDLGGTGDYREMEVEVVVLTDSSITVEVDYLPSGRWDDGRLIRTASGGYHVEIPENQVRRIARERGDPSWTGALIGAGAGAGAGVLTGAAFCEGEGGSNCDSGKVHGGFALTFGLVGAGVGWAIDSAIKDSPESVYLAPGSTESSFAFMLSPIVSKKQKGALFTVTW